MNKLYVVNSSHPSEAVKRALELKGIPYRTVELLIPTQAIITRLRFPQRTVPAMVFDDGEKVQGSRAIMRRLDELVPDPPLVPAGEQARSEVLGAERWGDEVLQPLARRVAWSALRRRPGAIPSYQRASQLPRIPWPLLRPVVPAVIRIAQRMSGATDEAVRSGLRELPHHLDIVDDWIADGVLGGPGPPNAADLQIGSSLRVLSTVGDVRPLMRGRPAEQLALRLFADFPGDIPAGTLPASWLTSP